VFYSSQHPNPPQYNTPQRYSTYSFDQNHLASRDHNLNAPNRYQPYPSRPFSRHFSDGLQERLFSDPSYDWANSPNSEIGRSRWSGDKFTDLHQRHSEPTKEMPPQPHHRDLTMSPREFYFPNPEEQYDLLGHGSYIHGPNGNSIGERKDSSRRAY
jgi:hypothetical protein